MRKILFLMLVLFGFGHVMAKEHASAKELFEKSKQKLSLKNVHVLLDLKTLDAKGNSKGKSLSVSYADFKQEKKVMVEILSPEKVKGTKILTTKYIDKKGIIEIYMPASGKIRKFRASNRNLKIMGSEIPITQFNPDAENDYTFSLLSEEEIEGTLCHKIKVEKSEESFYRIAYISVAQKQLVRVEKFDLKHRLLSVTDLTDYMNVKNSEGKMYPQLIQVKNLKSGKSSIMKVLSLQYIKNVALENFQLTKKDS